MKFIRKYIKLKRMCTYFILSILGKNLAIPNLTKIDNKFRKFMFFNPQYARRYECYFFFRELWKNLDCDFANDSKFLARNLSEESLQTLSKILEFLSYIIKIENEKNPKFNDIRKMLSFYNTTAEVKKNLRQFCKNLTDNKDGTFSYLEYTLPINHFETSVFLYKHSIDTLETLDRIKEKNIIDVGAFIGDSAIIFSDYTNKNVYSFEPSGENFENIKKTIELNKKLNIIPVKTALGDKPNQILYLEGSISCVTTHETSADKTNTNTIQSTTLDELVKENNLDVGLIKVDIEGFEQKFLKGAEHTIKTQKPALLISIYHNIDDFFKIKPIIESWDLGYKFRLAKPEESCIFETLLVAEVTE